MTTFSTPYASRQWRGKLFGFNDFVNSGLEWGASIAQKCTQNEHKAQKIGNAGCLFYGRFHWPSDARA